MSFLAETQKWFPTGTLLAAVKSQPTLLPWNNPEVSHLSLTQVRPHLASRTTHGTATSWLALGISIVIKCRKKRGGFFLGLGCKLEPRQLALGREIYAGWVFSWLTDGTEGLEQLGRIPRNVKIQNSERPFQSLSLKTISWDLVFWALSGELPPRWYKTQQPEKRQNYSNP